MNQLQSAIWQLYYNGVRPAVDAVVYSVEALVAKPIRELRESRNDEHIVAEARKCMALLTQGIANASVAIS